MYQGDLSVDVLRLSQLQVMRKLLQKEEGLELVITCRGLPPAASGVVNFRCPVVRQLKPFQVSDHCITVLCALLSSQLVYYAHNLVLN